MTELLRSWKVDQNMVALRAKRCGQIRRIRREQPPDAPCCLRHRSTGTPTSHFWLARFTGLHSLFRGSQHGPPDRSRTRDPHRPPKWCRTHRQMQHPLHAHCTRQLRPTRLRTARHHGLPHRLRPVHRDHINRSRTRDPLQRPVLHRQHRLMRSMHAPVHLHRTQPPRPTRFPTARLRGLTHRLQRSDRTLRHPVEPTVLLQRSIPSRNRLQLRRHTPTPQNLTPINKNRCSHQHETD